MLHAKGREKTVNRLHYPQIQTDATIHRCLIGCMYVTIQSILKGVLAKNERGYRRNAKNKRFRSLLILLLSVASKRRKLLKTIHTEERSAHTNSEICNIQLGSENNQFNSKQIIQI